LSDTPPPSNDPNPDPSPQPEPEKKFTQEELTRKAAAEKEQGKRAEAQRIANELGMSIEDAKALIKEPNERRKQTRPSFRRPRTRQIASSVSPSPKRPL